MNGGDRRLFIEMGAAVKIDRTLYLGQGGKGDIRGGKRLEDKTKSFDKYSFARTRDEWKEEDRNVDSKIPVTPATGKRGKGRCHHSKEVFAYNEVGGD